MEIKQIAKFPYQDKYGKKYNVYKPQQQAPKMSGIDTSTSIIVKEKTETVKDKQGFEHKIKTIVKKHPVYDAGKKVGYVVVEEKKDVTSKEELTRQAFKRQFPIVEKITKGRASKVFVKLQAKEGEGYKKQTVKEAGSMLYGSAVALGETVTTGALLPLARGEDKKVMQKHFMGQVKGLVHGTFDFFKTGAVVASWKLPKYAYEELSDKKHTVTITPRETATLILLGSSFLPKLKGASEVVSKTLKPKDIAIVESGGKLEIITDTEGTPLTARGKKVYDVFLDYGEKQPVKEKIVKVEFFQDFTKGEKEILGHTRKDIKVTSLPDVPGSGGMKQTVKRITERMIIDKDKMMKNDDVFIYKTFSTKDLGVVREAERIEKTPLKKVVFKQETPSFIIEKGVLVKGGVETRGVKDIFTEGFKSYKRRRFKDVVEYSLITPKEVEKGFAVLKPKRIETPGGSSIETVPTPSGDIAFVKAKELGMVETPRLSREEILDLVYEEQKVKIKQAPRIKIDFGLKEGILKSLAFGEKTKLKDMLNVKVKTFKDTKSRMKLFLPLKTFEIPSMGEKYKETVKVGDKTMLKEQLRLDYKLKNMLKIKTAFITSSEFFDFRKRITEKKEPFRFSFRRNTDMTNRLKKFIRIKPKGWVLFYRKGKTIKRAKDVFYTEKEAKEWAKMKHLKIFKIEPVAMKPTKHVVVGSGKTKKRIKIL